MKKIIILTVCIFCIFMAGCASAAATNEPNSFGNVEQITLVQKDFIVMGIIYLESTATLNANGAVISGSKITYEMLMKKAEEFDADDIANLRINETVSSAVVTDPVSGAATARNRVTYNATALAIKYIPSK